MHAPLHESLCAHYCFITVATLNQCLHTLVRPPRRGGTALLFLVEGILAPAIKMGRGAHGRECTQSIRAFVILLSNVMNRFASVTRNIVPAKLTGPLRRARPGCASTLPLYCMAILAQPHKGPDRTPTRRPQELRACR